MYRGEVDVGEEQLTDFLKTASGLRIRGLTEPDRAGAAGDTPRKVNVTIEEPLKRNREMLTTQLPPMPEVKRMKPAPEEIVIDENPTTSDISELKEERDEPSTTWSSAVTRPEESIGEDYSYQTDVGGYDDDKEHMTKLEMTEMNDNLDKHNKAYQCEMCNMSFNQKWLLR